jgi:hypothetical protein
MVPEDVGVCYVYGIMNGEALHSVAKKWRLQVVCCRHLACKDALVRWKCLIWFSRLVDMVA